MRINGDYFWVMVQQLLLLNSFANLQGDIPAGRPLKVGWQIRAGAISSFINVSQFTLVWDGTVDLNMAGQHELEFELMEPFPYLGENIAIMVLRPLDGSYYNLV